MAVERLESRDLLTTFTVTTVADSGEGSLRAAIDLANQDNTLDTIEFNIINLSGSFIKQISLQSDLPLITTPIHFDGTTMPTYDGAPLVILNGADVTEGLQAGLYFDSGSEGSVVEAITINEFRGYGIRITSDNVTVKGSYIGTNGTGTSALANSTGIGISGNNFTIGGTTAVERNIISGNINDGIEILGGSYGVVQGNYIGTDVTGNIAIPNSKGVSNYNGSHDNLIGGSTAGSGNVISGNDATGIDIFGGGYGTTVQGNLIGINASGMNQLGNGGTGIHITNDFNLIGGPSAAAANTIAFNDEAGILIESGIGNRSQRNSIYANGGLGIDLQADRLTPNDVNDSDTGANNLLNFPTITSAARTNDTVRIIGEYNGPADETLTLEFFSNIFVGSSNYGQGQFYLGETSVTTDEAGHATFDVTFTITTGALITATATDSSNNTSEFSEQAAAPDTIITLPGGPLTVSRHKPVVIDPQATVTTTRENFNDDRLMVGVTSGTDPADRFKIKSFKDEQTNKRVRYNARQNQLLLGRDVLATVYSWEGGLELTLANNAPKSYMQDIVRNITLHSKRAGSRVISIQILAWDADGISNVATRTIVMT